jgi:hypothetical protein
MLRHRNFKMFTRDAKPKMTPYEKLSLWLSAASLVVALVLLVKALV